MKLMKLHATLLTLCLILSQVSVSQPTTWVWAEGMGGKSNYDGNVDLARDASGNIYVIGDFVGTKNFGPYSLFATGFNEVFVAKFDPTGVCQWAVKAGANFSSSFAGGIAVSGSKLFIVGSFANTINCGGIIESSSGGQDVFIAQLELATGSCNWLKKAGGSYDDKGMGITAENGGGVFITGNYVSNATFGTTTLTTTSLVDANIFLSKFDSGGNCIWAVKAGGPTTDLGYAVEQLPGGSVFVTGYYQGTATFGTSTTITSINNYDCFLARYDGSGNLSWVQTGGGKGNDIGYGVSNDAAGNIYVSGFIGDTANFGPINVYDNEYGSLIIAKYTNGGIPVWVKTAGGFIDDVAFDISTDAVGSSYITGYINGNANFSGTPVTGVVSHDAYAAKYDTNGGLKWVTRAGSTGFDRGKAIVADTQGFCYVAGEFANNVTFGTNTVSAPSGEWGVFVARLGGGTVSVNEVKDAPFSFYPNPANEKVLFKFSNITDVVFTLDLLSVDGRMITSFQLTQNEAKNGYELNTGSLPNGNYLINVNTSKGNFSSPILIRHN